MLAMEHAAAGRMAEAEGAFRRVLALDPKHAPALNGLGVLAQQCGQGNVAIELMGQAIAVNDRVPQYHYNIALVLDALGRGDQAVTHYRRAVALKPDYAEAHNNLATALATKGQYPEAVTHFRRALARRADSPAAYQNLAAALRADGKPDEALDVLVRGLAVKATDELKDMFSLWVRDLQPAPRISGLRAAVERAMTEGWDRPENFSTVATALVRQNETIAACIERTRCWPRRLASRELFGPQGIAAIANDRLLRRLMVLMPTRDIGLERLLTNARLAVLDLADATAAASISNDVLELCCALAQQCFINEYVYDWRPEEQDRASALRDRLAAALASDDVPPALTIAAVAAYFPLHSLNVLPARFERRWPDAVKRLVVQQVREPAEEQSLRPSIPALTPIVDSVSALVSQQYEEHPYPRWIATSSPRQLSFADRMNFHFSHVPFAKPGTSDLKILIAGCGTGRHAIETAQLHADAKVLAVDLSRASLSYAKRKARELGIANIEFGRADILQLESLGQTFDVIEVIGVLHHLRDPLEGWRVLLNVLRPGGFIWAGLYSALARQSVTAARAFIAERGYGHTDDAIRQCRQDILALDDTNLVKQNSRSPDFFTTSECRDLMFHVQEHQTGIPAIKSLVADNHLIVLGFVNRARSRYAELYPDDKAMTNLDRWHAIETQYPMTFADMYQFWLQKPAS
jgi:2-polyprenyl-3-methyl-5-hydroxy-6-metoxy-1,4-benzoquinol methylase/Tfp pilus assembly protein PilF